MTDKQFRMLLDLCVVSDSWPLSDKDYWVFEEMVDVEARRRGYSDLVTAYYEFQVEISAPGGTHAPGGPR